MDTERKFSMHIGFTDSSFETFWKPGNRQTDAAKKLLSVTTELAEHAGLRKYSIDRLLLEVWRQMTITTLLFRGLMANEVIDDPLIDATTGKARDETVPQRVQAAQNFPFAVA